MALRTHFTTILESTNFPDHLMPNPANAACPDLLKRRQLNDGMLFVFMAC